MIVKIISIVLIVALMNMLFACTSIRQINDKGIQFDESDYISMLHVKNKGWIMFDDNGAFYNDSTRTFSGVTIRGTKVNISINKVDKIKIDNSTTHLKNALLTLAIISLLVIGLYEYNDTGFRYI